MLFCTLTTRASMFTKFCKCLHELQKLKGVPLREITVLIFSSSQIGKIANIFPKKNSLKNVPCANIPNCLV